MRLRLFVILSVSVFIASCTGRGGQTLLPQPAAPVPRGAMSASQSCDTAITANFNGTPIASGSTIWFSAVMKLSGIGTSPATISMTNSTVTFSANGTLYTVAVPNTSVTVNPGSGTATLSFAGGRWAETVPYPFSGNVLLDAAQFVAPVDLQGGIQNVTWNGHLTSSQSGVSVNWAWSAAVYKQFSSDYNALDVKPVDANNTSQYLNSNHAGTPEGFKTYVTGGAMGGGGANYTGSLSGTASATPCKSELLYIPNEGSSNVTVADGLSGSVVATIPVGNAPQGVAFSPSRRYVYITNQLSNSMSVIDTATNTVISTIAISGGPDALAISNDGSTAYVVDELDGTVSFVDLASGTIIAKTNVGSNPSGIVLDPVRPLLYAINGNGGTVSVISTTSDSTVATMTQPANGGNIGMAIDASGHFLYVADSHQAGIAVFDLTSQSYSTTISTPGVYEDGLVMSSDGTTLYATGYPEDTLAVINIATASETNVYHLGGQPFDLAFSGDGAELFVTNASLNEVQVVNPLSGVVQSTIPTGSEPAPIGNFVQ